MENVRKYPGFNQSQIRSEAEKHAENLHLVGYSVMRDVISKQDAQLIEKKLDHLYREQEEEFGVARLKELNEFEAHRGLLEKDPFFAELVMNPRVLEVVDLIVGESAILNLQNVSAAYPGAQHWQSSFHRDFAKDVVSSSPLAINAFWCITDFTVETGATWITPCSHRDPEIPSAAFIEQHSIQLEAPAGSILLWDSLLLHKAGFNSSKKTRYGINHMYTKPFLKQQLDFPVYLKGKYDIESKLGQKLGYWSLPPKSVHEYRVDPDKRTYRRNQG